VPSESFWGGLGGGERRGGGGGGICAGKIGKKEGGGSDIRVHLKGRDGEKRSLDAFISLSQGSKKEGGGYCLSDWTLRGFV